MSVSANEFASINPGVIGGGGNPLALNGIYLTTNWRVPVGAVQGFGSATPVGTFFGISSPEYTLASDYFNGFINKTQTPGNLFFSQYSDVAVSAYLRGGSLASMTLAQLQAVSGSLDVTIDGVLKSAASVSLTGVTSFSAAAQLLGQDLGIEGVATASFTGSIAATTLTVTAVASGTLAVGDVLTGPGVTLGTYISAILTGTGGIGTYTVSATQTVASEAITANLPGVTFDPVSNAFVIWSGTTGTTSTMTFATGTISGTLNLTQATGAVTSQGAAAMTPAGAMAQILTQTMNWAAFSTVFNPVTADKLGFAAWASSTNNRYGYVCWDNNAAALATPDTTSALGQIKAAGYANTVPVFCDPVIDPLGRAAALVLGAMASINFSAKNGRITFAFKYYPGIPVSVTDDQVYKNLKTNGYNAVVQVATANNGFAYLAPGAVTGQYSFFDEFINEVYLNAQLQLAIIELFTTVPIVPYDATGVALQRAACLDPINQMLNFGGIQTGIVLSALQASEVNNAAGVSIDKTLTNQGFYLQILPPSAQVRALRGSFITNLWYMDSGGPQQLSMSSIVIQ